MLNHHFKSHYLRMPDCIDLPGHEAESQDATKGFWSQRHLKRLLAPVFRREYTNTIIMLIESLNYDGIHYKTYPDKRLLSSSAILKRPRRCRYERDSRWHHLRCCSHCRGQACNASYRGSHDLSTGNAHSTSCAHSRSCALSRGTDSKCAPHSTHSGQTLMHQCVNNAHGYTTQTTHAGSTRGCQAEIQGKRRGHNPKHPGE